MPKPYAPGHPRADLLRRRALTAHWPLHEDWRTRGLLKASLHRFEQLPRRAQAMTPG